MAEGNSNKKIGLELAQLSHLQKIEKSLLNYQFRKRNIVDWILIKLNWEINSSKQC